MPFLCLASWPTGLDQFWSSRPLATVSEGKAVTTPVSQTPGAWSQVQGLGFQATKSD